MNLINLHGYLIVKYNYFMSEYNFSIANALKPLESYIHRTPLMSSSFLNQQLGHNFTFKVEALQKIGAFKARGAMNTLLSLKE